MGRRKVSGATRAPAFGMAILTPVLLAGAVAASPERPSADTPVAAAPAAPAVASAPPAVALRPLAEPAAGLRIPAKAMSAYRKVEQTMATAAPGCGISWNLLAGIGRIETAATGGGATAVRSVYARTTAPTKFASATWSRFAADGDGDGKSDPKNPFDATLATAQHLCSTGLDFRNQSQALKALLRYNDSMAFAANVLGWAAAYATGTGPLNLPPIYGPVPVLGPYLPGPFWALGAATQAGYLLPAPAAENPVPAQSAALPEVVVPPAPAPLVEAPAAAASVAPVAAPGEAVGSAVAPQLALPGDRPRVEPTEAFSAPPPPAPAPAPAPEPPAPQLPEPQLPELQLPAPEPPAAPESFGRQAGRAQADSASVQASGGNDSGGEGRAGGARRGGRG